MPKTQNSTLGQASIHGSGRSGGSGRGRPSSWERPGGGEFDGSPMGDPAGGPGRGGGRGHGGGTQGAFDRDGTGSGCGRKSKRQRRQGFDRMETPTTGSVRLRKGNNQIVRSRRDASLTDLAEKIDVGPASLVQVPLHLGEVATATQLVANDTLEMLDTELDYNIEMVLPEDEDRELLESFDLEFGESIGSEEDLRAHPPVVTVMGHVDHGKMESLDTLRHINAVVGEVGGITQAIGAYQVETEIDGEERTIILINTPGHGAFTAMCTRGIRSTDITMLVIAADDGVMPQTIETLDHVRAADVLIAVAANKIGKSTADPVRARGQFSEFGLVSEEYGGEMQFVSASAVTHEGLDGLLKVIIPTADAALNLRVNPDMPAQGVAIETHLDKGRGPAATVLVHRGTLRIGDSIVAGLAHGRVRAPIDDQDGNATEALPPMPVQVLELTSVPGTGDSFLIAEDGRMVRQTADRRKARMRATQQAKTNYCKTLDQLFDGLQKGETQELLLILKGDGAGSVEALEDTLSQIDISDEADLCAIDHSVGVIAKTDMPLATAPKTAIIDFSIRATAYVAQLADRENVDIRYHPVIYAAIDEIEFALKGMLKPILTGEIRDQAEIHEIFHSSKFGNTAGCTITEGSIKRSQKARLLCNGVVVTEISVVSLWREKDDVTEVHEGFEHGTTLSSYNDIHIGDVINTFEMVECERS